LYILDEIETSIFPNLDDTVGLYYNHDLSKAYAVVDLLLSGDGTITHLDRPGTKTNAIPEEQISLMISNALHTSWKIVRQVVKLPHPLLLIREETYDRNGIRATDDFDILVSWINGDLEGNMEIIVGMIIRSHDESGLDRDRQK